MLTEHCTEMNIVMDWADALPPCVLFTVFAVISLVFADPTYNLLMIEAIVIRLFTLIHFTGVIYKMMYLDIIEMS